MFFDRSKSIFEHLFLQFDSIAVALGEVTCLNDKCSFFICGLACSLEYERRFAAFPHVNIAGALLFFILLFRSRQVICFAVKMDVAERN